MSSIRWAATSLRWARASRWRSTGIPRRGGAWKPRAWRCASTRARISRARVTAGRRASRARSSATEHEVDGLLGCRGTVDVVDLQAGLEDDHRPAEELRE